MTVDSRNCWLAAGVVFVYLSSVVGGAWWMWRDALVHERVTQEIVRTLDK